VATGGAHRGTPARIALRRNESPRLLVLLTQQPGQPVRVRLVVIGDLLISEVTLSIDEADLARAAIAKVIEQARLPEHTGAVPPADDDGPEGYPIGTRHGRL
jgi:hypothetical protein